jgi:cell division inhibitor SepF
MWSGGELEEDIDEEPQVLDPRRRQAPPRTQPTGRVSVAVRLPLSYEDARPAADGLKDGRQQIINLEKTNQETFQRILDFLSGVTYALNGFVEKVGDRVYLFAPSNVTIDLPEDLRKPTQGLTDRGF